MILFFYLGGAPVTMPTSWSDFLSHAGVPKLIPNPLAVDNVSLELIYFFYLTYGSNVSNNLFVLLTA